MCACWRQAVALRARAEARVREAEQTLADLEARAGIARQRIAILERELEAGAEARRQLAADQQALQVMLGCCDAIILIFWQMVTQTL